MKVLLIRHAESKYNKLVRETTEELQTESTNKNLIYFLKVRKDPEFIDTDITELGHKQCQKSAAFYYNSLKQVKVVLVSPMNRALKTCSLIFGEFLNGNRNNLSVGPRVIVIPDLREVLESNCDVVLGSSEKQVLFPHYDFSEVSLLEKKFGFGWFYETMFNQHTRKKIREEVAKKSEESDIEKAFQVVNVLRDHLPKYLEEGMDVFYRTRRFRVWFRDFIAKNNYLNGEIAIVGHSFFFETLTSKNFTEKNEPVDGLWLKNCEVTPFAIDPFEI